MKINFNGGSNPFFDELNRQFRNQSQSQGDDRQEQPGTAGPQSAKKKAKPRATIGTPFSRFLVSLIAAVVFAAVYFYVVLPPLNPHSLEFWTFLCMTLLVYIVVNVLMNGLTGSDGVKGFVQQTKKSCKVPAILILASVAVCIVGSVIGWQIFRAADYSSLLVPKTGNFAEEVSEVSWDQIPMLDEDSANTLANRKLGELSDLVSQFEVDDESEQINYQDAPVRVTYLNYGDIIKWFKNTSNGIPAYIITDMRTQEVTVVRLEEGIKYSPTEHFNEYVYRHLRFCYPTAIFGEVNFEIDEAGVPYWVASVEKRTIGLFSGADVKGAVLMNAVTGECEYFDVADVPTWVDRVYSSSMVMEQYDYYGQLHNGFLNSIFGQTGCTISTDGYNYIAMDDDVWLYTGVTSLGGDQSNVGFILVNQRTKESAYYPCAGADEYSGMDSAQGAVQQYSYKATFPLLLNISGEPTYFMALKDASQLVKMYAMVNVRQYQVVATGYSMEECLTNYQELLVENKITDEIAQVIDGLISQIGTVAEIRSAVMDGDTTYFIRLQGDDVYYTISASEEPMAVILNVGDSVTVEYHAADGEASRLVPAYRLTIE